MPQSDGSKSHRAGGDGRGTDKCRPARYVVKNYLPRRSLQPQTAWACGIPPWTCVEDCIMLTVNAQIEIPLAEFHFSFSRSSGPGGQNVNKVNTKVTLRWDVSNSPSLPEGVRERFCSRFHRRLTKSGEFVMHSQRFRDQGRNVADCLGKLRGLLLEVAAPVKVRRKRRPSRGAIERRLNDKRRLAAKKQRRRKPAVDD